LHLNSVSFFVIDVAESYFGFSAVMIDQKIDSDGDLVLTANSTVKDKAKVEQDVKIKLQYILGEWFKDTSLGIPYFTQILGNKEKNIDTIISIFSGKINSIENVLSSRFVSYAFENGKMSLNFDIQTTFGGLNMWFGF
jgi:hypothetical protein